MKNVVKSAAVFGFPLLLAGTLAASELTVTISESRLTVEGGAVQLCLRVPTPSQLAGGRIDFALLEVPVRYDSLLPRRIHLRVHPVTGQWTPGEEVLLNPHIPFADSIFSSGVMAALDTGLVRINVTEVVRAWVEEGLTDQGLVIFSVTPGARAFRRVASLALPVGTVARLRIYYTPAEGQR